MAEPADAGLHDGTSPVSVKIVTALVSQ
jgi:hypothetical protein